MIYLIGGVFGLWSLMTVAIVWITRRLLMPAGPTRLVCYNEHYAVIDELTNKILKQGSWQTCADYQTKLMMK